MQVEYPTGLDGLVRVFVGGVAAIAIQKCGQEGRLALPAPALLCLPHQLVHPPQELEELGIGSDDALQLLELEFLHLAVLYDQDGE